MQRSLAMWIILFPGYGGQGMLLRAQLIFDAYDAIERSSRVIFVIPLVGFFDQTYAEELAGEEELIFICGHYGRLVTERIKMLVTDESQPCPYLRRISSWRP